MRTQRTKSGHLWLVAGLLAFFAGAAPETAEAQAACSKFQSGYTVSPLTVTSITSSSRNGNCKPGEVRLKVMTGNEGEVIQCVQMRSCVQRDGSPGIVCKENGDSNAFPTYKCAVPN